MVIKIRRHTDYQVIQTEIWDAGKSFNCPTCSKRVKKGQECRKAMFMDVKSGYHTRKKLFCSGKCVPEFFYGGAHSKARPDRHGKDTAIYGEGEYTNMSDEEKEVDEWSY